LAEAILKRSLALELAAEAGFDGVLATSPPTVRWLLCGRGRPVDGAAPESSYAVVLLPGESYVVFPDIEGPRVAEEERFEELGYSTRPYSWHEGPAGVLDEILHGRRTASDTEIEAGVAPFRRSLVEEEKERLRAAGAEAAAAMAATLEALRPEESERDVAGRLAAEAYSRGFFPTVVLVAGFERQGVYRHPVATDARIGAHALLALTAERDGLHLSLTRLAFFGRPPAELGDRVRAAAAVDAAMLRASTPGATLGDVFGVAVSEYTRLGYSGEWRHHHQGGIAGYRGREVFAVPGDRTVLPGSCAVAWNPSITGGAKSEDTALVSVDGVEIVTRTSSLPEIDVDGIPRPDIVSL
jgi:Xaa-Pro dipeptidase